MIAGLTGGIGSGKSTVAKLFALMGCAVFESDEAAKQAYFLPEVRRAVTDLLGAGAYRGEGEIDRAYISERVFGDTTQLQHLNGIIHPAVRRLFEKFVAGHPGRVIIKESALLFEAKVTGGLDRMIVVAAPDEVRIKRVMARDGLSRSQVEARMRSQLPQETKIGGADYVINNGEHDLLIEQVESVFEKLQRG